MDESSKIKGLISKADEHEQEGDYEEASSLYAEVASEYLKEAEGTDAADQDYYRILADYYRYLAETNHGLAQAGKSRRSEVTVSYSVSGSYTESDDAVSPTALASLKKALGTESPARDAGPAKTEREQDPPRRQGQVTFSVRQTLRKTVYSDRQPLKPLKPVKPPRGRSFIESKPKTPPKLSWRGDKPKGNNE